MKIITTRKCSDNALTLLEGIELRTLTHGKKSEVVIIVSHKQIFLFNWFTIIAKSQRHLKINILLQLKQGFTLPYLMFWQIQ